jgi:small-conductance mechanosensitive channel
MANEWWERLLSIITYPLFNLGNQPFSFALVLKLAALLVLTFILTSRIRRWLVQHVLVHTKLESGTREAVGTIVYYVILVAGVVVGLQTIGIDLTALSVAAGGLGIGIGFGLQNIANNFMSGFIVLLERPIKVGDRIQVAGTEGRVVDIHARATTVLTNDNIAILIPNSRFITENVINWSYSDTKVRFRVPVGVSYNSDPRLVEKLLLTVAAKNQDVLTEPAPAVRFLEFGDSSLNFELRVWSSSLVHRKGKLISDLNFAILEIFRENNIEIPFPQRDIHIRTQAPSTDSPA